MPARSCQCPERRAPITSRRWEVCSKPGDGTTVVRCKACGAMYQSYRFPADPSEKVDRWAALFCAADLMICGAAGLCPNYTSTPDWRKLRRLSDKWVTGLMEMCPGCDEEGDKIYEELMA